ncbi:MAG: DedA family protein [Patescibacteria group bacterium]
MFSLPIIYFITQYGYLAILIGSLFEGETILIIGGLAVHDGLLDLHLVFLCSLVGTIIGDNIFFLLGRYKGHQLVAKYKFFSRLTTVSEKFSGKPGPYLAFSMRFLYGFRHLIPFSLGMSSIKTQTFMFFNFLGGLSWVLVVGFAGYFFGDVLEIFFGRLRHYEFKILVIIIIAVVIGIFVYKISRKGIKGFFNC